MLPPDVLEMVFLLLPPEDRKASMLVSKSWNRVGQLSKFWDWVYLKVTEENLVAMTQNLGIKRLESAKKICLMAVSKELLLAIEKHPGLKVLKAISCNMPRIHPRLLARVVIQMDDVDLSSTKLTIQQCQDIFRLAAGDSKLKKLNLGRDLSSVDPDPETLAVAVAKLEDFALSEMTPQQSEAIFRCASGDSKLKKLSMHRCNLSFVDSETLAAVVAKLEDLDLSEISLTPQQSDAFFRCASGDSKLKKLCMRHCNLSSVDPETMAGVVAKLEDVNFIGTSLTTQQCQAIFRYAAGNSKLKKLGLCRSNLSSVDPETLAGVVAKLEDVNLSATGLTTQQCQAIFRFAAGNSKLKKLDLYRSNLSSVDPETLAVAVSELEAVNLSDASLTTQQCDAIFRCASSDSKLGKIDLSDCVLSSVDPETLARGVAKLEDVNLSDTRLTTQQYRAIFRCAAGDSKLKKLGLHRSPWACVADISTVDPETLANAVAKIKDVDLNEVKLTDLQREAIIAVSGVARLDKLEEFYYF